LYDQIKLIWRSVVIAALPYLQYQYNDHNFEFVGIDIIADINNQCWLIEVNR